MLSTTSRLPLTTKPTFSQAQDDDDSDHLTIVFTSPSLRDKYFRLQKMNSLDWQGRLTLLAIDESCFLRKECGCLTLLAACLLDDVRELQGRQSARV